MRKPIRAWGGFCDGKLDQWRWFDLDIWAVYRVRREATKGYEDVRRIEIREVPVKRKRGQP